MYQLQADYHNFCLIWIPFSWNYLFVGFKLEYPDRDVFSLWKGTPIQNYMIFEDITTLNIHAYNIDLTILESNTDTISVKNSIETTGIGVLTTPKIWGSDNTLFYDQGLIMKINTWEIIEDTFDLSIHTSGSLIIEVPKDRKLDFVIKNPNGTVDFDIDKTNPASLTANNELSSFLKEDN